MNMNINNINEIEIGNLRRAFRDRVSTTAGDAEVISVLVPSARDVAKFGPGAVAGAYVGFVFINGACVAKSGRCHTHENAIFAAKRAAKI
jgi:hypothetical protein